MHLIQDRSTLMSPNSARYFVEFMKGEGNDNMYCVKNCQKLPLIDMKSYFICKSRIFVLLFIPGIMYRPSSYPQSRCIYSEVEHRRKIRYKREIQTKY